MKKLVLILTFLFVCSLNAHATKIIESPRSSLTELLGHLIVVNHDNNTLDFYRLPGPDDGGAASEEDPSEDLMLVNSFSILDEGGEDLTEVIEAVAAMRISVREQISLEESPKTLASEEETEKTILAALFREQTKEGKNNKAKLKVAFLFPTVLNEVEWVITDLTTLKVVELGEQPVTKF